MQASLACTFNKPPMKKGPKGSRAKVISELRKSQADRTGSSASEGFSLESPLTSPTFARQQDLLAPDLVDSSLATFFDRIYPTLPILHRGWVRQKALETHMSVESYCLIGSLCAFMIIQPGVQAPVSTPMSTASSASNSSQQQNIQFGVRLLEDVKRRRSVLELGESPSTATVLTSFLMSATLFGLEKHTPAWFHLQEAILFARILRIHDEKSYEHPETPVDIMNRRIFFILFVSERYALEVTSETRSKTDQVSKSTSPTKASRLDHPRNGRLPRDRRRSFGRSGDTWATCSV